MKYWVSVTSGLLIYGQICVAVTYNIFCVQLSNKLLHFCLLWMRLTHLLLMSALNYFHLSPLFNLGHDIKPRFLQCKHSPKAVIPHS